MNPTRPDVAFRGRYTITEACKALGVCYNTLRKHADNGEIRVVMGKGGKYVWGEEIIRFWESRG